MTNTVRISKKTVDNTSKPLPSSSNEDTVTAIVTKTQQGAITAQSALDTFTERLRKLISRESEYRHQISDLEKELDKLQKENSKLRGNLKTIEHDPMEFLLKFCKANDLAFRYENNGNKAFRNGEAGGKWVSYPEIMEFREKLMKNASKSKFKKIN